MRDDDHEVTQSEPTLARFIRPKVRLIPYQLMYSLAFLLMASSYGKPP